MNEALFTNARLIMPDGIFQGELRTQGNVIAEISCSAPIKTRPETVIDLEGEYLSPGFVDVHTHGGGGGDFMDGDLDSFRAACKTHLKHGTTTILPTNNASTKESMLDFIELFSRADRCVEEMPNLPGLHLEGPYLARGQCGAQNPIHLRAPRPEEYLEILKHSDKISRWSFAVELDGADLFLKALKERGVVASLAHSDATCADVYKAYENGLAAMTHFYSCMAGVRRVDAYRTAGAIEAGYLIDELYVEAIADGRHLPDDLLRLIYRIKGPDRVCLVTDSMRGAGMPDGRYKLGSKKDGVDCIVEDGVAKLPDRSAFAGSTATSDLLARTMRRATGAPLHEVVKMMTLTPARLIKKDGETGSIAVGKNADLIAFDEGINVSLVMARGNIVGRRQAAMNFRGRPAG
jgi:N-acetylglucosamine-6-phosphate deacetylase